MLNFLKSTIRIIRSLVLYIILIGLVIFMVNNRDDITIHFYPLPFDIDTRVFIVMLMFFVFGMLFGILACSANLIGGFFKSFRDRCRIKKLEKEVAKT